MKLNRVIGALGVFGLLASAADTTPPLKIVQQELPNGLKIVMAEDHSRPVVNLQVWYHVGSKDEKTGRTGFAHLFEHMMFRGSKNVGPEEHMRYVRDAGGELNAYTSFDITVYWQTVPSNYLDRMLWLEADRMASLDVSEENFKKEREVVKEERRLRFEDPPYGPVIGDVLEAVYQVYPYKHPPIGSMEDLNKANIADVREFHSTYYVPNNATLVIVGDFDQKEALGLITKYFSGIPKSPKPVPRVTATEPDQKALAESTKTYKNAPLAGVVEAFQLPPMNSPDRYALEIASSILSDGQSSRLYKRLVYDEQAAVAAFGQAQFLEGPSFFFGAAIANQGKDIKELQTSFQYVLEQIKKQPVTDEELAKAKNKVLASYITGRETMQSKADGLGQAAVQLGDPEKVNTEMENYRKVTAADVQRVCQKYLTTNNETRLWIKPGGAQ
jgi:zinc protease